MRDTVVVRISIQKRRSQSWQRDMTRCIVSSKVTPKSILVICLSQIRLIPVGLFRCLYDSFPFSNTPWNDSTHITGYNDDHKKSLWAKSLCIQSTYPLKVASNSCIASDARILLPVSPPLVLMKNTFNCRLEDQRKDKACFSWYHSSYRKEV
jgi:hypothetical protein